MASKYHNKRCEVDGISFMSQGEARRYSELKLLEKAKQIQGLQLQVKIPLYAKINYIADFVYYENGKKVIEDFKGFRTSVYKIKKKLIEQGIKDGTVDADKFIETE